MDRYLVISADGHAGLPAADYREYVLPKYRDAFDLALPIQIEMTETMAKQFLVSDINKDWRNQGKWTLDELRRLMPSSLLFDDSTAPFIP